MTTAELQCKAAFALWLLDQGCLALLRAELHAMTDDRPARRTVPVMTATYSEPSERRHKR